MARRSILLVFALIIALVGTAMIVLYVRNIDARATQGQELVTVLTATERIDSGEDVSTAFAEGKILPSEVRADDMVPGALDDIESITDLVALSTIYPGEQIIGSRFGNLGQAENLVIPEDKMAVSVDLTDNERVSGFVNPGAEVAVFVSADTQLEGTPVTKVLIPRVQVIGVGTTSMTSTTTSSEGGDETTEVLPRTLLTLAVDQKQAELLMYANRNADISVALLTDKSKIGTAGGVDEAAVLGGM